jgi:putative ABC transport system substrate-binding protein
MRRRALMLILAGTSAASRPLRAEGAAPLIGFLGLASAEFSATPLAAFHEGLRDQGFIEGKNVSIEYRWAGGNPDRLPAFAAELVRLGPAVIVTSGGPAPAQAAYTATQAIPIVASSSSSVVKNFSRPGGNLTGSATQTDVLNPKRLQLLHEAVPGAALIGVLANPTASEAPDNVKALEKAAQSLGVRIMTVEARSAADFEAAFGRMAQQQAQALLVMSDPSLFSQHRAIVALALRYRLPAIYEWGEIAQNGGLMAYGDGLQALYRRVGDYAGRVPKGRKPADLPLDQPPAIRLVVNLRTAQALGLTIPQSILSRADEIIE